MKISKTIVIPASALATGEDAAPPPKEGDTVSFTVEGKVTQIGDMLTVTPVTINGQPVGGGDNEAMEDTGEKPPSRQELEGWAQQSGMTG